MRILLIVGCCVLLCAAGVSAQEEPKDDPAPTAGVVRGGTGGPDGFGYTYEDSTNPDCAFQWVDISATGANQGHGDDATTDVPLGGPGFDFYGTVYNTMAMDSNGRLSAPGEGSDFTNACPLPGGDAEPMLGAMWDDMDPGDDVLAGDYHEYFPVCPRPGVAPPNNPGCNIFQWTTDNFPGTDDGIIQQEFQAILYDSWNFAIQVNVTDEAGSGSTEGIQDTGPTTGLTYACDAAASFPAGTAVCFAHPLAVPVTLQSIDID